MKNQNPNKPQRSQLYLNGIVCNGEKTLDFMIPGTKVGFVIGKGGEMIRTLQVWLLISKLSFVFIYLFINL